MDGHVVKFRIDPSRRRMAAWLRAELELLGVLCVAADRHRCGDAPAHAVARAAVDAAVVGVEGDGGRPRRRGAG